MSIISYAQNFEDVMLWRALKHVKCGFYIDVGANDPVIDSVTKLFYDSGWRGINVEPDEQWFLKLEAERPRDINLQCAAADYDGELNFYVLPNTGLSTSNKTIAERHEHERNYTKQIQTVSARTLTEICEQYNTSSIHFLKVDVEGAEKAVLDGLDLQMVRPWIVIVEATRPNSQEDDYVSWEPGLLSSNYKFVYFDGLNRFYLAAEHNELADCFNLPPNIWDDFVLYNMIKRGELGVQAVECFAVLQERQAQLDTCIEVANNRQDQLDNSRKLVEEKQGQLEASVKSAEDKQRQLVESQKIAHVNRGLAQRRRRLLVDVSTLLRWDRPVVGIVRAQLELVRYVFNRVPVSTFVAFNGERDCISIVSKEEVARLITKIDSCEYLAENEDESVTKGGLVVERLKSKLADGEELGVGSTSIRFLGLLYAKFIAPWLPIRVKFLLQMLRLGRFRELSRLALSKLINRRVVFGQTKGDGEEGSAEAYDDAGSIRKLNEVMCEPHALLAKKHPPLGFTPEDIYISIGLDWDHSNYPLLYKLKKTIGFKVVGAFYDAIPVVRPDLVQSSDFSKMFSNYIYMLVNMADSVFCISNFSKGQLEKIIDKDYECSPELRTIYLGDDLQVSDEYHEFPSRPHGERYALYVSTIEVRKNHQLLVDTWVRLWEKYGDAAPDLVLVGMIGWGVENTIHNLHKSGLLDKKIFIYSNVSDGELHNLYEKSLFCVFPSLMEGWGLGAVEALKYGKVCLISSCAALSEATQRLVPVLDEQSADVWVKKISEILDQPGYLEVLEGSVAKGFESKAWTQFATEFVEFVREEH